MPPPRKNIQASRKDGSDSDDNVVVTRKPDLFDWDQMGLGLEMDLSSSNSEYSDYSSDRERGDFELDPKTVKSPNVDQETFDWIRNLVSVRKAKHSSSEDHSFRTTGRGWLHDQHKALERGTIPVTFKCILAASGVSRLFNKCRDEFRKPEYRSRYWTWSVNFVLLIDYFIDNGNVEVTDNAPKKYHALLPFLSNCKNQKNQGHLSLQRDQLLTALGMVWDVEEESEEDEGERSDSSSGDSRADETWEMPSKTKGPARPKRAVKNKNSKKRKRAIVTRAASKPKQNPVSPPPSPIHIPRAAPMRLSLTAWARQMLALRHHFKRQRGEDDLYDIPHNQLSLRIWMNAEVARCSTGVLSDLCCGILKAAELTDSTEPVELDEDCEQWCRGFVAYLDYMIRKGKVHDGFANFMYNCRRDAMNGSLPKDRIALLRGVDEGWLDSREMQIAVFNKEKRRSERVASVKRKKASAGNEIEPYMNGEVVEVVLDSGTKSDERRRKRRKKTALVVTQMLSCMIGGEVAVTVEGRDPTPAERDAKEWILRLGAKAFDLYARNWFRAAAE